MRSLAAKLSSIGLHFCLMLSFKSAISLSIGMMTLNVVLSPSMRHQRVYVDDILDGREKLEEEKGRSPEVQRVQRSRVVNAIMSSFRKWLHLVINADFKLSS
jgi:hypothetical protein